MSSKVWDYIVLTVVVIGAINWGLIGFFKFDLVSWLFGSMTLFPGEHSLPVTGRETVRRCLSSMKYRI